MDEIKNGSPSHDTLKKLFHALPGYVAQHKKKMEDRAKMRATHANLPRKVCNVCGVGFDIAYIAKDSTTEVATCKDCQSKLDSGHIAFIEGIRYAFVKPTNNRLADMAGKIVKVGADVMDAIQKKKDSDAR